jgi:predicted metalloprotease
VTLALVGYMRIKMKNGGAWTKRKNKSISLAVSK